MVKVGNKAPAFTLMNQREEKIRLSDFVNDKNVKILT